MKHLIVKLCKKQSTFILGQFLLYNATWLVFTIYTNVMENADAQLLIHQLGNYD